jgi:hypothetical protein
MAGETPKSPQELLEGTDYYIESGRWVFTAAYLLRRGKCCESGCRHCPYRPADPTPPPASSKNAGMQDQVD